MTNQNIQSIDLAFLSTVTGGRTVKGKGGVTISPTGGSASGEGEVTSTNYESCVDKITSRPGWTPEQLVGACGLPPAKTE